MPPTTDNPTEPVHDGSDEEWARWEQTFRDARPVLPEAAMARICDAIRREADPETAAPQSRLRRRIFLLVIALIAINAAVWAVLHFYKGRAEQVQPEAPGVSVNVRDSYPLDVPIGPALAAPARPILPLTENEDLISSVPPAQLTAPASHVQLAPDLLKGAERLVAASPNAWHALGLLEMRRAANVSAPMASPTPPNVEEFRLDALWRLLGEPALDRFCDESRQLRLDDLRKGRRFWQDVFKLLRASRDRDPQAAAGVKLSDFPEQFPSKAAERARFDLLTELGVPKAQAALEVLTTRSYEPLRKLRALDNWDAAGPLRDRLHEGYLAGSHDVVERLFALRLLGRARDADDLVARAGNLPYLVSRRDLEVLLVRLGETDAWDKFLRPLMEDEAGFVENPPQFDQTAPRAMPVAVVQAAAKSEQGGAIAYIGTVRLAAGPWRLTCEKLAATRAGHGALLQGSGMVHLDGVIGLVGATAEEFTFNTETGELNLGGGVHLEQWSGSKEVKACTIARTGEVRVK